MTGPFRVFFQPEVDAAPEADPALSAAPVLSDAESPSEREVIEAVRQAARLEPADPDYYFLLGDALCRSGRHAEAVGCFREALRLDPGNVDAHLALGHAFRTLGRREDALTSFREAAGLAPEDVQSLNALGAALAESGSFREAAGLIKRAVAQAPAQAHLHANLGVALAGLGETAEAVRRLRRAVSLAPASGAMYRALGLAFSMAGDRGASLRAHQRAVDLQPKDPHALLDLADELYDQQRAALAEAAYEKALALDPGCLAGRAASRQARQGLRMAGLQRELRSEASDRAHPAGAVLRFPFAALLAVGHAFRRLSRPRRALYALLTIAGALAIVLPAATLLPHVVRHYALQDDLASIARSPTANDLDVRDLIQQAIERRGLQGVIDEGRVEVRSVGHWRTITAEYQVSLAFGPYFRRTLRFRLDAAEPFFAAPSPTFH